MPRVAFDGNGTLSIAGQDGPLVIRWRRSNRARRLCLRNGAKGIELVVPQAAPLAEAGSFAASHAGWVRRQIARSPDIGLVAPGSTLPFQGLDLTLIHRTDPKARGPNGERVVWLAGEKLHVRGVAAHLPRRVEDWLRAEARRRFIDLAHVKGERLGRCPARITVRDTASRWGSCSAAGALNFSWRLIMAPDWVMDYVAAHEVAHLRHMHHRPRFWRACADLVAPADISPERVIERARAWLRQNGAGLHAIRFRD